MKKIATIISLLFIGILPTFAQVYVGNGDYDTNPAQAPTCYNLSYNIRKGDKDSIVNGEVSKLQEAMNQLGYMSQDPTGTFGNATLVAVKSFQSANNLSATGYFGTLSRAALQSRTCATTSYPTYPTTTCALYTTYISNTCVCPTGYYAAYTISGSSAFTCQNGTGYTPPYSGSVTCSVGSVYSTNSCTCPSGYVTTAYGSGTFTCQTYTNYNPISYTPYQNTSYNPYNSVCAVGENVQVDLSRCTCPTGYTSLALPTNIVNGARPGFCQYQGWYGY